MIKIAELMFEVVKILWSKSGAMTPNEIMNEIKVQRDWKLASLMTTPACMVQKGNVYCGRST